jgi:hypothetical protein
MGTFIKRGLNLGLLGVALWSLTSFGPSSESGPGGGESPEGITSAIVISIFEVSRAWGQEISGAPLPYRGRLVIHYPLLNSILLLLLLGAVLGVAWFLNQWLTAKLKGLEQRIAYLEYTVKDLQARQKEAMDDLRRQMHNLPGKPKADGGKKDPDKDTYVGKSPVPRKPDSPAGQ